MEHTEDWEARGYVQSDKLTDVMEIYREQLQVTLNNSPGCERRNCEQNLTISKCFYLVYLKHYNFIRVRQLKDLINEISSRIMKL